MWKTHCQCLSILLMPDRSSLMEKLPLNAYPRTTKGRERYRWKSWKSLQAEPRASQQACGAEPIHLPEEDKEVAKEGR